ncbi:MAG TPA: EutN/CcmL family microcompartment protein [Opitutaceae bacterium]|nr:EutN/CcmL family microcompartment protein [Opitutaceae bacterium]
MRLGHVIGKVTLSKQDPAYKGARFLVVQPFAREQFKGAAMEPLAKGLSLVVYDNLGADLGHVIGFTEGAEATAPFPDPTPVDAFNAAIVDQIFYTPPSA